MGNNIEALVKDLYLKDEYIERNPYLHEEDTHWKIREIVPLLDNFIDHAGRKDEINLLDVGGGAGLILSKVSVYAEQALSVKVNKYAIDLSPGMLEIQRQRNPDIKKALNEDIRNASLADKEIDLTLIIDVLEHVPDPASALEEIKRISKFAIFKVPLEDCLAAKILNLLEGGRPRKYSAETYGHIHYYHYRKLRYQIEEHTGRVLVYNFPNVFHLSNGGRSAGKKRLISRTRDRLASCIYALSPRLCSEIFGKHVVLLVRCY